MPNETTCQFDACCVLTSAKGVSNLRYCPTHRCKRRAENARKAIGDAELFDVPCAFRVHSITRAEEGTRIIIVNDLQQPFQDKPTLQAVEKFWDDFEPNIEVYAGDIADFYTISSFDKNPSRRFKFADECANTRRWLHDRAHSQPNAQRIFIEGNHEDRMRRWLWRHGPELHGLPELSVSALLGLDETGAVYLPYMSVFDFLGFRIEHGWKASSGGTAYPINVSRFMATKTGSSGLCGHTHRFSTYAWTDSRGAHSYIENGCLCRMDLEYAPFPNWQHAFCVTVDTPVLTSDLRWVPAGAGQAGAGFLALDEYPPRRFRGALVTKADVVKLPVFRIELETGEVLYATGE